MIDLVYHILTTSPDVTDIVGSNVYSEWREPGSTVPACRIDLVGVSPVHTSHATIKADRVTFSVYAYGQSIAETMGLSGAVSNALAGMDGSHIMDNGMIYDVAMSRVESYDLDSDYDGNICSSQVEVSFHITH